MVPPPPGLFSTMAVCLRRSCRPVAISRATTSLEPPGVNGTMMCIVLLGKFCAQTDETAARAMMHATKNRAMLPPGCDANDDAAQNAAPSYRGCSLPQATPGDQ